MFRTEFQSAVPELGFTSDFSLPLDVQGLSPHNLTTNSTLVGHNLITLPLDGRPLCVDATHEVSTISGADLVIACFVILEGTLDVYVVVALYY